MPLFLNSLILIVFLIFTGCSARSEDVFIQTDTNRYHFKAEVADTPDKAAQGLMYRRYLPPDQGMIFINDENQIWHMWMKNTYIALDMIFFARDGKIVKVVSHTNPLSLQILSSDIPVAGVLEVNAGTASTLNIRVGDYIQNHRLNRSIQ